MKPSDVNRIDPSSTSLAEYKKTLSFLKIPDLDYYDDETNKQRYICGYNFYVFVKCSIISFSLSISALLLIFYISASYSEYFKVNSPLSFMWPWNQDLANRLTLSGRSEDANIIASVAGIVSTIWLSWIAIRVLLELKMQGSFYSPRFIAVLFVGSALMWLTASVNFYSAPSFGPMISDKFEIMSVKKLVLISLSYWMTGFLIMLVSAYIRFFLKRVIASLKRDAS